MRRAGLLACLIAGAGGVTGCAAALPIALGIQGAISAGSDIIGGVKWWEDRAFQKEANAALRATATEIKALREAVEAHQAEIRRLAERVKALDDP